VFRCREHMHLGERSKILQPIRHQPALPLLQPSRHR
jgi:hypothetical protein